MKNAFTPLVSTFFLIVFAIALGALVMSWGSGNTQATANCYDTEIGITKLNDKGQLCIANGNIEAIIENNGDSSFKSIKVVILTEDSVYSEIQDKEIAPGEFGRISFPINVIPVKIRFIPLTDQGICIRKYAEIENIGGCNEP